MNEPTNFTVFIVYIDLLITSRKQSIFLSGVGEPFLGQNIRCHCPVFFCIFDFNKTTTKSFCKHVLLYDKGHDELREEINNTNWQTLKNQDIDTYTSNVTNRIISISKNHIPKKEIIVRQSDPEWLTSKLKKMMRKRKRLYDKNKRTKRETDYTAYKIFRNKITSELTRSKKFVIDKLANKLSESNLKPKDYWKTLKQFIKP